MRARCRAGTVKLLGSGRLLEGGRTSPHQVFALRSRCFTFQYCFFTADYAFVLIGQFVLPAL